MSLRHLLVVLTLVMGLVVACDDLGPLQQEVAKLASHHSTKLRVWSDDVKRLRPRCRVLANGEATGSPPERLTEVERRLTDLRRRLAEAQDAAGEATRKGDREALQGSLKAIRAGVSAHLVAVGRSVSALKTLCPPLPGPTPLPRPTPLPSQSGAADAG